MKKVRRCKLCAVVLTSANEADPRRLRCKTCRAAMADVETWCDCGCWYTAAAGRCPDCGELYLPPLSEQGESRTRRRGQSLRAWLEQDVHAAMVVHCGKDDRRDA